MKKIRIEHRKRSAHVLLVEVSFNNFHPLWNLEGFILVLFCSMQAGYAVQKGDLMMRLASSMVLNTIHLLEQKTDQVLRASSLYMFACSLANVSPTEPFWSKIPLVTVMLHHPTRRSFR